ncbi:MAG: YbbR-like domain-containing protein [Butyricicoccus sp.]
MKQWLKKQNIWIWILSFLISVFLWNYIMDMQNPTRTLEYRDISVQLTGADDLFNRYSLTVIEGADTTVNVRVSASSSRLANLTASQIKVRADLSESISAPGTYDIPYEVILPESGMTCVSHTPSTITVKVDRMETKSVPVEVNIKGDALDGYKIGEPELQTDTVNITGPEQELDNVANAVITLQAKDLTESISNTSYDYKLVDSSGKSVNTTNISRETTRIKLSVDVLRVKTVPLSVTLVPKDMAKELNASVELSVNKVEIQGDPQAVDAITSIELGSINVNKAEDGDSFPFEIKPPTGVKLTDGQEQTVHAVLSLDDIEEKQITVTNINISDSAQNSGKTVELRTESMKITVNGRKRVLDELSAEDFSVVAEINSAELSDGRHKVGVRVEAPDNVTVSGAYSVELVVSK